MKSRRTRKVFGSHNHNCMINTVCKYVFFIFTKEKLKKPVKLRTPPLVTLYCHLKT